MNPHLPPQLLVLLVTILSASWLNAATLATDIGLKGDGITDDTAALQTALGTGDVTLVFPKGTYLLGTIRIPANTTLRAEPGARLRINPATLKPKDASRKNPPLYLFILEGNQITLDGIDFDFTLTEAGDIAPSQRPAALIHGDGISHIRLLNLVAERAEPVPPIPLSERKLRGVGCGRHPKFPANKTSFHLSSFSNSSDLLLRDSRARFMQCMINLERCSGIFVESNRAENCYAITRATQADQYIRHTGNWSREVAHQCRWWGGNANDRRKLNPEDQGWGTAATVTRHAPPPGAPGYNRYTFGAFDIIVANNYAEYGQTLAWGSKGRQILFQGNIARFMTDYALGSEGGENVTFNGNLLINSYTAGLVTMYWSEKVVMTGNTVLVRDEPMEGDGLRSSYATPAPYQGGLIRLHSAGSPSGSGAGSAIITGNLLVNELTNRPRAINIEAGRDVFLSGNKIRNGSLRVKPGAGRVTVTGNEFSMTIPHTGAWLNLTPAVGEVIIKDNLFKNTRPLANRSPTELLLLAEAGPPRRSKNSTTPLEPRLRIIEGNTIQGFPLAIYARAMPAAEAPSRILIARNTTDGILRFDGQRTDVRLAIEGNLDLACMQPLTAAVTDRPPPPLPEPAPTPEDDAAAASEKVEIN